MTEESGAGQDESTGESLGSMDCGKVGDAMGLAVAGFHRSGTSSVMQHLTQSGLNPGGNLIGANEYNPYGYFEDWGPVRFHDTVLEASGLDWASAIPEAIPLSEEQKAFIQEYCAKRATETPNWGFKDPRVCQFLEHWMRADPTLRTLIIYRSPIECSWSIYRRAVRDSVRGSHAKIVSRILCQPDHALALWVTHNRKLLEVMRQFGDRTVAMSHAGFAAGFNVAAALRDHFEMGLTPAAVKETFRENLVTTKVAPLPVSNSLLRNEAIEIWNQLQRLDLADRSRGDDTELRFIEDPTGLILTNQLLTMEITESRKIVNDATDTSEIIESKLSAARKVALKLQRWPFSIFFLKSMKYKKLIEEILS